MLKNNTIIIPLGSPWDFHCELEKPTSKVLSEAGNKVIVVDPENSISLLKIFFNNKALQSLRGQLSSMETNLVFFPMVSFLPFQRLNFIKKINQRISLYGLRLYSRLLKRRVIFWSFFPRFHYLFDILKPDLIIYDYVDFQSSINKREDRIKKHDNFVYANKSDFIFANSKPLYEYQRRNNPKTYLVPQGFDPELFLNKSRATEPNDLKGIPNPRIGFIGNFDHRVDAKLVFQLIKKNRSWSFVFIGPQSEDKAQSKKSRLHYWLKRIKELENAYFLGLKSRQDVYKYMDNLSLGIIPYDTNQAFCQYCYPAKIFEYFARGKMIVSTPIESLKQMTPLVETAGSVKEMTDKITVALMKPINAATRQKQKSLAKANSWENKIETISKVIGSA